MNFQAFPFFFQDKEQNKFLIVFAFHVQIFYLDERNIGSR